MLKKTCVFFIFLLGISAIHFLLYKLNIEEFSISNSLVTGVGGFIGYLLVDKYFIKKNKKN